VPPLAAQLVVERLQPRRAFGALEVLEEARVHGGRS
jgi:hypothetical protein